MHKLLTIFSITALFLVFSPKQSSAQVFTSIGDYQMCYNAPMAMPVVVQNMTGVDAIRLVLAFNPSVIEYVEHFAVNSALAGETLNVTNENDSIVISWTRTTAATISQDTLLWVRFLGLSGSTQLQWNAGSSYYHTASGNAIAIFGDGKVTVDAKINVKLTEIDPTCASVCMANYLAEASGGTAPYIYRWNGHPGRFDNTESNLCAGKSNVISIIDSIGCRLDSNFVISGLPGANVNLIIEGNEDTTIYLQNPVLSFRFEENANTHVIEPPLWEFGDGDTAVSFNPTHVFSRAITNVDGYYDLKLHIVNDNGCDSSLVVRIFIKDAQIKIPGVITPNGDSYNEAFMILNKNKTGSTDEMKITSEFQRMELVIFDRWGRKLYDDSNYKSDWSAKGVPDGAYYYKLKTVGFYKTETFKGSITILGSGQ